MRARHALKHQFTQSTSRLYATTHLTRSFSGMVDDRCTSYYPKIVFGESHEDYATNETLEEFIRRTNNTDSSSYSYFLDELPSSLTLDQALQGAKALEDEDHHIHLLNQIKGHYIAPMTPPNSKYISCETPRIGLYKTLQKSKVAFQGIDVDDESIRYQADNLECLKLRDDVMTRAILSAPDNSFARVGLYHIEGIQERILKQLSPSVARSKFAFFYLYSKDSRPSSRALDFRAGKIDLPLDLTVIPVTRKKPHEVVDIIMEKIDEKKSQLANMTPATRRMG